MVLWGSYMVLYKIIVLRAFYIGSGVSGFGFRFRGRFFGFIGVRGVFVASL